MTSDAQQTGEARGRTVRRFIFWGPIIGALPLLLPSLFFIVYGLIEPSIRSHQSLWAYSKTLIGGVIGILFWSYLFGFLPAWVSGHYYAKFNTKGLLGRIITTWMRALVLGIYCGVLGALTVLLPLALLLEVDGKASIANDGFVGTAMYYLFCSVLAGGGCALLDQWKNKRYPIQVSAL